MTYDEIELLAKKEESFKSFLQRQDVTLADLFTIRNQNDSTYNRIERHWQQRSFWLAPNPQHPAPCVKLEQPTEQGERRHIEITKTTLFSFADATRIYRAYGPFAKNRDNRNMVIEVETPGSMEETTP